jgi:UDP-N-acetylglucosamine pyrophosphorylase
MQIIILAAGKGSRMNSALPKVMHEVGGIPMLEHVVQNCHQVSNDLVLVHSKHLEPYLHMFRDRCKFVNQAEQLGTAHAVAVAKDLLNNKGNIGVIYGDNPLITPDIIMSLFRHLDETNSKVVTLAFEYDKPNQYGRIILDHVGNFKKIVELKFATAAEKKVTLCNSGIMAFAPGILEKYINDCLVITPENIGKELYLTNIIEICVLAGEKVSYYKSVDHELVVGVNTQTELDNVNAIIQQK